MIKQHSGTLFNVVGAILIFYGIILIWLNEQYGNLAVIAALLTPIALVLMFWIGRLWLKNRELKAKQAADLAPARPTYTPDDARHIKHVR